MYLSIKLIIYCQTIVTWSWLFLIGFKLDEAQLFCKNFLPKLHFFVIVTSADNFFPLRTNMRCKNQLRNYKSIFPQIRSSFTRLYRIHQIFSLICITSFSQFEQLNMKTNFLLVPNRLKKIYTLKALVKTEYKICETIWWIFLLVC